MTVHILRYGHPVCRFTNAMPADWPEGHKWIGDDECELATCPGCRARATNQQAVALSALLERALENDRAAHWIVGREPNRCYDAKCPRATMVIRIYRADLEKLIELARGESAA